MVALNLQKKLFLFSKNNKLLKYEKIFYKILDNGVELYNLKKATKDSAGFDLVAAIKKIITQTECNHTCAYRIFNSITKRF